MRGLVLKLQALQYPALESLTADESLLRSPSLSSTSLRTLVAWLEASKIRLLPVGERAALQDVQNDERWSAAFLAYMGALNCTRTYAANMTPEQTSVVLDWLASQAVSAEYADRAGEFNALSRMWFINNDETSASSSMGPAVAQQLLCSGEAFETEVRELAALFKLPLEPGQHGALLRVVRKRVEECLIAEMAAQQNVVGTATQPAQPHIAAAAAAQQPTVPAAAGASSKSKRPVRHSHVPQVAPVPTSTVEINAALDALETGFPSTGDVQVERAARVLRLLFLHDLRASQNLANELMALAQNYTSDPKTNSKAGKVGR